MEPIHFTDDQISLIYNLLLNVKNNLVYNEEDKIYRADYENWLLTMEKDDYKILSCLVVRIKGAYCEI